MGEEYFPTWMMTVQEFVQWQQSETSTLPEGLALLQKAAKVDITAFILFSKDRNDPDFVETSLDKSSKASTIPDFLTETQTQQDRTDTVFSKTLSKSKEYPHCLIYQPDLKMADNRWAVKLWSSTEIQLSETEMVFLQMLGPALFSKHKSGTARQNKGAFLQEALDTIEDGFILYDKNEQIISFNKQHQKLFPHVGKAIKIGGFYEDILRKQIELGFLDVARKGGDNWIKEKRIELKKHRFMAEQNFLDGRTIRQINYQTQSGNTVAIRSDISELVAARQKALDNEELYRTLLSQAPIPLTIDIEGVYVYANSFACDLAELADGELVGRKTSDFLWKAEIHEDLLRQMQEQKTLGYFELDFRTARDRKKTVSVTTASIIYQGKKARFTAFLDVTEASITRNALTRSEKQNRDLLELIPDAVVVQIDNRVVFVNQSAVQIFRAENKEAMIGMLSTDLSPQEEKERILAIRSSAFSDHFTSAKNTRHLRVDNTEFHTEMYALDVIWNGKPGTMNIIRDNSSLQLYENSIVQKENEMSVAQELGHFGHWRINIEENAVYWSDELYRIHGLDPKTDELDLDRATAFVVESDRKKLTDTVNETIKTQKPSSMDVRIELDSGDIRNMTLTMRAEKGGDGRVVSVFGVSQDVTEQRSLEEKLRQSQKMEAVGQLTGGVAHDFNNLLAVIQGNAEMLLDLDSGLASQSKMQLNAIMRASERGANLTKSMLAYSRKQSLTPEIIYLDKHVESMILVLRRTLGENFDIRFTTDAKLWPCVTDQNQVHTALLNLALNSRDAMPNGGSLTIGTRNVSLKDNSLNFEEDFIPGDYVMLSVSDTGTGISLKNTEHVFEPFFTTKETGKGTGLGLSMVYGFTKQSGGQISLQSELDKGTTIKIFLPRSEIVETNKTS